MQTDPLGDFLTAIRNAARVSKKDVLVPYSRLKSDVAHVLKKEGYLTEVETVKVEDKQKLKVTIRREGRTTAIRDIRRVSKPGLRRYVGAGEIPRVLGGLGISVLSTPKGVMAGHQAKKQNLGGELLLTIY